MPSGAPSWDPIILINAYAQVFVVSVAEVVVCWALIGSTFEASLMRFGRVVSIPGAALIASMAFGIYHYAHSAPFNTHGMVLLWIGVGLITGVPSSFHGTCMPPCVPQLSGCVSGS
jgi:hypothetical protein